MNTMLVVAPWMAYSLMLFTVIQIALQLVNHPSLNRTLKVAMYACSVSGLYLLFGKGFDPLLVLSSAAGAMIVYCCRRDHISHYVTILLALLMLNLLVLGVNASTITIALTSNFSRHQYEISALIMSILVITAYALASLQLRKNQRSYWIQQLKSDVFWDKAQKGTFLKLSLVVFVLWIVQLCSYVLFDSRSVELRSVIFGATVAVFGLLLWLGVFMLKYAEALVNTKLDQKNMESAKEFLRILRAERHDFNFHMTAVLGMIDLGQYDACRQYLTSMLNETNAIAEVMPVQEPAVGSLLLTMKENAAAKGIRLSYQIYYDMSKVSCAMYELNKVLGNLIQNAIDETEGRASEDAWIDVTILKKRNHCIIRVANPIKNQHMLEEDWFAYGFTSKSNHSGIGLNTVRKIVEACSGAVFMELENKTIHLIVQIPLDPLY